MKATTVLAAIIGTAGLALAQGVTSAIAPTASAPAGCSASYDGTFEITVAKVAGAAKRDAPIAKRASCSGDGILVATLSDGTLLDAEARTGYIASNYQFQFDKPAQAGAIYTSGFSACSNGSLALGGSAVFYECESGDFFNLYDRDWAAQCSPVEILMMACGGTDSESGDGQVVGTQVITTTVVSDLSDGQPQVKTATTGIPLCQVSQIKDGQVQVATTPCTAVTTAATTSLAPVSQYSDGQIQVTPAASVPTVSSGAVATTSAGAVTLPTETSPSGTAATGSSASNSTLATSAISGTGTSSATASSTSAPAKAGAADLKMPSVAALMVVLGGAVALF